MNERIIAIVSGRSLNLSYPRSGEETFLQNFVKILEEMNFKVVKIELPDLLNFIKLRYIRPLQIHLVYVPFKSLILLKKAFPHSKFIYHVYYLNYATLSKYSEIQWREGLAAMGLFVDSYLATSPMIARDLKYIVPPFRNIFLLEPYYKCNYCNLYINYKEWLSKIEELKNGILKILYIGYLNEWRFPYNAILRGLAKLRYKVNLTVYTLDKVSEKRYSRNNISVNIISRYITENLKCDVYRKTHFFIFLPLKNTAIIPPLTLLESVYHGAIPIVSSFVKNKIIPNMPESNVVRDFEQLPNTIESLVDAIASQNYSFKKLLNIFYRYYDKKRFLSQLFPILEL